MTSRDGTSSGAQFWSLGLMMPVSHLLFWTLESFFRWIKTKSVAISSGAACSLSGYLLRDQSTKVPY